jgi:hypothetical protein
MFMGYFTQHTDTNHNLGGPFTATDKKLLTNIYAKTNRYITKNKHLTAVGF